jgi:hypothetical protein
MFDWRQGTAKVAGRIALAAPSGDAITEYLSSVTECPVSGFQRAA